MAERNGKVLEFMRARRSVPAKALGEPGPGAAEIRDILTIASRVPDHGKIAPWRFVEYTSSYREKLDRMILQRALILDPDLPDAQREVEATRMRRSPVVIGLVSAPRAHPKVPEWEQMLSCGAAGMNALIAANALGYDAQWITEWIAFDTALAPAFGVRPDERLAGFLHIGTRTMPKTERDRPDLDTIHTVMDA